MLFLAEKNLDLPKPLRARAAEGGPALLAAGLTQSMDAAGDGDFLRGRQIA